MIVINSLVNFGFVNMIVFDRDIVQILLVYNYYVFYRNINLNFVDINYEINICM